MYVIYSGITITIISYFIESYIITILIIVWWLFHCCLPTEHNVLLILKLIPEKQLNFFCCQWNKTSSVWTVCVSLPVVFTGYGAICTAATGSVVSTVECLNNMYSKLYSSVNCNKTVMMTAQSLLWEYLLLMTSAI